MCIKVIIQDIYCKYTLSKKLSSSLKHTTSATDGITIYRFLVRLVNKLQTFMEIHIFTMINK